MGEKTKKLVELLKVLANESCLLILRQPIEGPKTVSRLAESIPNITQPVLSQHLALLRAHGILDFIKSGQSITYRVKDERVEKVIGVLKAYYCKGEEK